ncbi:MAG: helix-turn-helix domain-containing protein [Actinobacteria bacterium]|nr:helix-turn-helix domain-containing protein [Actinomycetota bacterium]MBU1950049.1 helix-turn-helix domain-containing protein [Candidatus Eisenbacteria bacterium]
MNCNGENLEAYVDAMEAARILGVSRQRIWRMARRDQVPYIKMGRSYRFRISELIEALKRGYYDDGGGQPVMA